MSCPDLCFCSAGSCCDLREHICKPHNRGLNNKCYDDCMCTEGEFSSRPSSWLHSWLQWSPESWFICENTSQALLLLAFPCHWLTVWPLSHLGCLAFPLEKQTSSYLQTSQKQPQYFNTSVLLSSLTGYKNWLLSLFYMTSCLIWLSWINCNLLQFSRCGQDTDFCLLKLLLKNPQQPLIDNCVMEMLKGTLLVWTYSGSAPGTGSCLPEQNSGCQILSPVLGT